MYVGRHVRYCLSGSWVNIGHSKLCRHIQASLPQLLRPVLAVHGTGTFTTVDDICPALLIIRNVT